MEKSKMRTGGLIESIMGVVLSIGASQWRWDRLSLELGQHLINKCDYNLTMNKAQSQAASTGTGRRGLRGFWSLFITQFQGAFSDNVLKNLVIFMMIGMNLPLAEKHKIGESVGDELHKKAPHLRVNIEPVESDEVSPMSPILTAPPF